MFFHSHDVPVITTLIPHDLNHIPFRYIPCFTLSHSTFRILPISRLTVSRSMIGIIVSISTVRITVSISTVGITASRSTVGIISRRLIIKMKAGLGVVDLTLTHSLFRFMPMVDTCPQRICPQDSLPYLTVSSLHQLETV